MKDLQDFFPALAETVYLNSAASGLLPRPVFEWRRDHDRKLLTEPGGSRNRTIRLLHEVKTTIGEYLGSSPKEIALIPNFSIGINMVLEGLVPGQKIMVLENEYPSVDWPVMTRDFEIIRVAADENLENNIQQAVEHYRPDIFLFSIVQWISGIKIDLEYLKVLKSYNPGLLLIADGTQYIGTEKFDFSKSPLDVLAASSYKWLHAGFGNGFLLIKPEIRSRILPKTIGFHSAEDFDSAIEDTEYMKHFEPGHLDTLNFGSLQQAVEFVKMLGAEKCFQQIAGLSASAKSMFAELNLLENHTLLRENHSSIFNIKGDELLFEKLKKNKIRASFRGKGIRVSFHYYNSMEDLEYLLEVIQKK